MEMRSKCDSNNSNNNDNCNDDATWTTAHAFQGKLIKLDYDFTQQQQITAAIMRRNIIIIKIEIEIQ